MMNYLKKGWVNTFQNINKHKRIFVLLIILQIIFLVSFAYTAINFQVKVLDGAKGVMEPLENANYDAESIKSGDQLVQNPLELYKNYTEMRSSLIQMLLWLLLIFIAINGSLWILTHKLLGKKTGLACLGKEMLKFITITLIFLTPYAIFSYLILKSLLKLSVSLDSLSLAVQIITYSFMLIYYLMAVAFAFINIESWRSFVKRWFETGIKNIHWCLIVAMINLIIFTISLYLVSITTSETSVLLMMITSFVLIIILVITRIFWVASLRELNDL